MTCRYIAIVLTTIAMAGPLAAQDRDARVLRPGEAGIEFDASFIRATERFGPEGNEPLASDLAGPVTGERLPELLPISTALESFFAATGAELVPGAVDAGVVGFETASSARILPIRLSLGVLPRIEVGVSLPIQREQRFVRRISLADGQLGVNEDVAQMIALLGSVDPTGELLGQQPLLPIASSAAGQQLRSIVLAATGEELPLPEVAVAGPVFASQYPEAFLPYTVTDWVPGDVRLSGRLSVLNMLPDGPYPSTGGMKLRVAVEGGVRLPTGTLPDTALWLGIQPSAGRSGWNAGGAADLFVGSRGWITAGGGIESVGGAELTGVPPSSLIEPLLGRAAAPLQEGDRTAVNLFVVPRVRLTEEINIGATIDHLTSGAVSYTFDERTAELGRSSLTSLGLVIRYTNLPATERALSSLPLEAVIGVTGGVAGSGLALATRRAFFSLSLYPRLWGRPTIDMPGQF